MGGSSSDQRGFAGSGWVKGGAGGCDSKQLQWSCADVRALYQTLISASVFERPVDNFGRFNQASRRVALAVALALHDAGIRYAKGDKQDIGIIGTGPEGALETNVDYFQDYVTSGRKMGRGNLFIYTLPSSPLAESAIHFGLQGPLLYVQCQEDCPENGLALARSMVKDKDAPVMLVVRVDPDEARCSCIKGDEA